MSVDEYISKQPKEFQSALTRFRKAIREAAPRAEEKISYRIPSYKYNGWLVFFSAGKNHCSLITVDKTIPQRFGKELSGFKVSGTTIHFTPEKQIPISLVKRIVKDRINSLSG